MNTIFTTLRGRPASFLVLSMLIHPATLLCAATTVDPVNHYAYGANVGWMDARGDTANGAVVGEYVCSGYLYAANVGWVNLGAGSPANGIRHQNNAAADFGVNQDGFGNLRGYAYGANIGWINFEDLGAPRVDLVTGKLSGYAYSANCGWISLSNTSAFVQTDSIQKGADTDADGLPDAWELTYFGNLSPTAAGDDDHDGVSNLDEYLAGTSPIDGTDYLHITSVQRNVPAGGDVNLLWTSQPTRFYGVQHRSALDSGAWLDVITFPDPGASNAFFIDLNDTDFYRVRAFRPLMP